MLPEARAEHRQTGSLDVVRMAEGKKRAPTLYLIILIKLLKGVLLLLIALGVYSLAGQDLQSEFSRFLRWVNLDPEKEFFTKMDAWLDTITATNVKWVATGTLLYSLFSLVEGCGLILRVSWAGWMAIGESAFFIPIEIYELIRKDRFSPTLLAILGLNVLIVWYIYRNRERLFRHHH